MGVTGLWTVLQPCARPIKLETLNKKRLAVDASIWIYQFLKAVRDKEGNALRNSHVVGFFRRICKLLFFGIKPVFVFDGGAPALKRQTIIARKSRREGRREDAVRTAGKLLAIQMQRRAEEEEMRKRDAQRKDTREEEEEELPENLVYVEELQMTPQERQKNRAFKKQDAYHLPQLETSLSAMGAPNDPRVMSQEELEEYARQFHTGEDVNLYDFSKIDFNGTFFQSLPANDRYNILNAARLRSRLRMGYSKDQLDNMFQDRMAFSRFQIDRVKERNELTQRLMNLNGMNGEDFSGKARVAGEKGKEYVLVKNEGVEGGWALGVVSNKQEGERNKPIDLDAPRKEDIDEEENWEDEDGFEDVPIEGLNRLPKPPVSNQNPAPGPSTISRRRQVVNEDPESLFVPDYIDNETTESFEDILPNFAEDDDEDLQRAIAMSLEKDGDGFLDTDEPKLATGLKNSSAPRAAPIAAPVADISGPFQDDSEDDDYLELQAVLEASKRSVDERLRVNEQKSSESAAPPKPPAPIKTNDNHGFDGPLPFESIKLGVPKILKKKQIESEGGFEKKEQKKAAQPLPPWFSGDIREAAAAQKVIEDRQFDGSNPVNVPAIDDEFVMRVNLSDGVIDVDAIQSQPTEVVQIDSSGDEDVAMEDALPVNSELKMNDVAELVRAVPPKSLDAESLNAEDIKEQTQVSQEDEIEWSDSDVDERQVKEKHDSTILSPVEIVGPTISSRSSSEEFEDVEIPEPAKNNKKDAEPPRAPSIPLPHEDTFDQLPVTVDAIEDEDVYSDPEDEDLFRQLANEAEEHARFAATLNSTTHLQSAEDYEKELKQLRNQQKKDRRDADEVSQIMITECQQLLRHFSLPYVTAPMEAEAQCAELVNLGLVDGIITDDSDIFLFGGTRVYKNMFNQSKFVECYLSSDLEKEYALTREKIIQIAHLLGSDYTEGVPSVGPVTALEIVSEFPDLETFHEWWVAIQSGAPTEEVQTAFKKKFKRNAAKIFLPPNFPDKRVDEAYLHPEVDADPSPFAWGVPDLDSLRNFLMATVGWSDERVNEILVPVIRDMNRREAEGTQSNITHFFGGAVGVGARRDDATGESTGGVDGEQAFAPRRRTEGKSKRMETALGRLKLQAQGTHGEEQEAEAEAPRQKGKTKRKVTKRRKRAVEESDEEEEQSQDTTTGEDHAPPRKKVTKRSKRKK